MAPTNRGDSSGLYILVTGVVLVCLVSALMVVGMLRLADALGPKVGDILSFGHLAKVDSFVQKKIVVNKVSNSSTTRCNLDVRSIQASGGSIVIEAFQLWPEPMYQVHWAGIRTSAGGADCGAVADLLLSRSQVIELMSAANGPVIASEKVHPDLLSSTAIGALP